MGISRLFHPSNQEKDIFNSQITNFLLISFNRESVAGSVIQATGKVKFEDGLRIGVLQEDCLCPCSGLTTLESDMARP